LHDWMRLVGRLPAMHEWSASQAREHGRSGEWERWAREYPALGGGRYHGTCGAALLAAGLPDGRASLELSLSERVDAARRCTRRASRCPGSRRTLGVAVDTVRKSLRASRCGWGRNWMVRGPGCSESGREETTRIAGGRAASSGIASG
jgi:hypothetical protein